MRVAIDGPAGSGKSTVAHALAERCGLMLLDTGAMYRSVTLACLTRGVPVDDAEQVAQVARTVQIGFGTDANGGQTVTLDGKDVTAAIRTAEVDASVSAVAAIPAVREAMVAEQRRLAAEGDVVAEGRDIGTVVFPDAEVKVFLTADPTARAHRRAVQRAGGDAASDPSATANAEEEQAILADLKRRDEADSTREVAPLRAAEDAVRIDSSTLTVEEEVAQISALIDAARGNEATQANDVAASRVGAKEAPEDGAEVASDDGSNGAQEDAARSTSAALHDDQEDITDSSSAVSFNTQPQVEGESIKSKAEVECSRKKAAQSGKEGPLRVFGHNTEDDFYDHAMSEFPLTSKALLALTIGVCGAVSKLFWPWKVENGEALWNAEGGRMLVMNHESMIDPVLVAVTDYAHGRRLRPIFKSELVDHKLLTWLLARCGAIPVTRGKADVKAVRRAQRALQRGEDVLVFPEGTRIHSDDQEITIHAGFALMAQLAKAPVVPVGIVGARDGAPGGNGPLRPGRIWMRVGKEATFGELPEKGRKKQAKAMEKLAMERVYALRDALRAAHPGKM